MNTTTDRNLPSARTLFTVGDESRFGPDQRDALKSWREDVVLRLRRDFPNYIDLGGVLFVVAIIERGGPTLLEEITRRAACPSDMDARLNVNIVNELKAAKLIECAGYGKSQIGNNGLRNLWALQSRERALAYLAQRCGWLLDELGLRAPMGVAG